MARPSALLAPALAAVLALGACSAGPETDRVTEEPAAGVDRTPVTAAAIADRLLEAVRAESGVPGLSAAVALGDRVVWTGTSGWADRAAQRPVTPETRFRLASVSKLFTATVALRLAEEGLLDLDADVRAYVASWPDHDGAVLTPRLLAAHAAGINHYESLADSDYVEGRHYDDVIETLSFFDQAPLRFAPGSAYAYSSFGYVLLTAAMVEASGQTLDDLLASRIFVPAGLDEISREDVRALPPSSVTLYELRPDGEPAPVPSDDQSLAQGATGMRASARDVARFGADFLSGALVGQATRDRALAPFLLATGEPAGETRYSVGFGWRLGVDWAGRPVAHHAGLTRGARAILLGYPQTGAAVALLSNARWTSRMETTAELLAAPFLDAALPPPADCPVGVWAFAGTFEEKDDQGRLRLTLEEDLCVGELISAGALGARFGPESDPVARPFTVVRIGRRGRAQVFAVAYPWGLARIRLEPAGDGLGIEGDVVGWPLAYRASRQGSG